MKLFFNLQAFRLKLRVVVIKVFAIIILLLLKPVIVGNFFVDSKCITAVTLANFILDDVKD